MSLASRNALVTGSTSGIGLAIARALAKEGANVVINGMGDPAAIETERAAIEKDFGVKAFYNGADMTKPAEIAAMVAEGFTRARASAIKAITQGSLKGTLAGIATRQGVKGFLARGARAEGDPARVRLRRACHLSGATSARRYQAPTALLRFATALRVTTPVRCGLWLPWLLLSKSRL